MKLVENCDVKLRICVCDFGDFEKSKSKSNVNEETEKMNVFLSCRIGTDSLTSGYQRHR